MCAYVRVGRIECEFVSTRRRVKMELGRVRSVNLARPRPNPFKSASSTGIYKEPVDGPVEIRPPGSKERGLGSGLVGDFVGDRRSHGGNDQAVYAYAEEDLHWWQKQLGEPLTFGQFGENLTTTKVDVNGAKIGERWRVGDTLQLQVTDPRIPCGTFRGRMDRAGWLKTFVRSQRPGAYLRVVTEGVVRSGDTIEVVHQPDHDVTISLVFRALTLERDLLPQILEAHELTDETRDMARRGEGFSVG
jgi:MOSC domain-containing protein YiiM